MEKPPGGRAWRLVGTVAEGTLCHKPCTVSGGGKSEISKPITDAVIQGSVFVADFKHDFDLVEELINRNYGGRFRAGRKKLDSRPILSPERSLGSVIKLFTPAPGRIHGRVFAVAQIGAAARQGTRLCREAFLQA
jgi:hypothetical protein